jgi:hypothetical protein
MMQWCLKIYSFLNGAVCCSAFVHFLATWVGRVGVILFISVASSCENIENEKMQLSASDEQFVRYPDPDLELFLDSVSRLTPSRWTEPISFMADSIFKNQIQLNRVISDKDFVKLKRAIHEGELFRTLDLTTARTIFGDLEELDLADYNDDGIPFIFMSFDSVETALDEFAICLNHLCEGWNSVLYFFQSKRVIAKHTIFHRYGLDLNHFRDSDNSTVIYYKQNYGSGTGIWQFNYNFYKFHEGQLIPVLNELQSGNLTGWGATRNFWLESSVVNTSPLTLNMIYHQQLRDALGEYINIVKDSILVTYQWSRDSLFFNRKAENDKRLHSQVLTYYINGNEWLFMNAYSYEIKQALTNPKTRTLTLDYLNIIRNHYSDISDQ